MSRIPNAPARDAKAAVSPFARAWAQIRAVIVALASLRIFVTGRQGTSKDLLATRTHYGPCPNRSSRIANA